MTYVLLWLFGAVVFLAVWAKFMDRIDPPRPPR
jgi:hypothetical protein